MVATELSTDIMERRGWGLKITSKVLVHISGLSLWIFGNALGTIIVPEGGAAVICEMLEEHLQQLDVQVSVYVCFHVFFRFEIK